MNALINDTTFEDIKVCIEIPPDMSEEAQKLAFEENSSEFGNYFQ